MNKYNSKFFIGDYVVVNVNSYATLRYGTIYRVIGVTATGSIQLDGVRGTYNPDKFRLYTAYDKLSDAAVDDYVDVCEEKSKEEYFFILDHDVLIDSVKTEQEAREIIKKRYEELGYNVAIIRGERIPFSPPESSEVGKILENVLAYRIVGYDEDGFAFPARVNGSEEQGLVFLSPIEDAPLFSYAEAKALVNHYESVIGKDGRRWIVRVEIERVE